MHGIGKPDFFPKETDGKMFQEFGFPQEIKMYGPSKLVMLTAGFAMHRKFREGRLV
jgi:hypothetical protein